MNAGRGCGVLKNPKHEAFSLLAHGAVVEAYHPLSSVGGAACDTQGAFSDLLLPCFHSRWLEPAFLHPFEAASNACSLRWEVLQDLSHAGSAFVAPMRFISSSTEYPSCISQGSHPNKQKPFNFAVRFEDCIDVLIGCEDSWNLTRYSIHHDALSNWHAKPWSKRRIAPATRQKPPLDVQPLDGANGFFIPRVDLFFSDVFKLFRESLSMGDSVFRQFITSRFQSSPLNFPSSHELNEYQCDSSVCLAPLSFQAVLSRLSDASMNHDHVYFMQIGNPAHVKTNKQDENSAQDTAMLNAFEQGHANILPQSPSSSHTDGSSRHVDSPRGSSSDSEIQPPSLSAGRQDVIMFHLHEPPIRAFLDWTGYEQMMVEIAHHYSTARPNVVDAYEIHSPLHDLPVETIPIIVHLLPDIAIGQNARLVLFDMEFHGHQIEAHFRLGPVTQRFVLPTPEWVDRNGILTLANVDQYCQREQGRCLVYHNGNRWPDYDFEKRQTTHGDHIRVSVPPSERFRCATRQVIGLKMVFLIWIFCTLLHIQRPMRGIHPVY